MIRPAHFPWTRSRRGGTGKNPETTEVMEPIRQVCKKLHIRCERNNAGMARGFKPPYVPVKLRSEGTWDLEVFLPDAGCSAMVECKMPGESLTPEQQAWGKLYRACSKETIVATSVEQFLAEVEEIRRRRCHKMHTVKKGEEVADGGAA